MVRAARHIVDDDMDNLVQKFGEPRAVLFEIERLGFALEGNGSLAKHDSVGDAIEFVEPYIEQIEFIIEYEAIEYFHHPRPLEQQGRIAAAHAAENMSSRSVVYTELWFRTRRRVELVT
jgi:hypothetical protein